MKAGCTIFLLMILSPILAIAQDCDKASVSTIKGKWTEGMKGSTAGLSSADLAKEKSIIAQIHKMMQSNYSPTGVDADYNGVYPGYKNEYRYANTYSYALRLMPYICDGNKLSKAHETNTSLNIAFNEIAFGPEIYEPFTDASAWDEGYRSMNKIPQLTNGVFFYEEKTSLGFGNTGPQYTWIVTPDKQLPFLFVTRKEFLEKKKQKLSKGKTEEAERLKSATPDIRKKMLDAFDLAIVKIDKELAKPASELEQHAVVKQDPKDYLSHLFTTTDDPFARVLIKPNPLFFDKKLPKYSAQFISIVLKGDLKNPVLQKAMSDVQKAIDFSLLKSILRKP